MGHPKCWGAYFQSIYQLGEAASVTPVPQTLTVLEQSSRLSLLRSALGAQINDIFLMTAKRLIRKTLLTFLWRIKIGQEKEISHLATHNLNFKSTIIMLRLWWG